jgi:hypothetical protein
MEGTHVHTQEDYFQSSPSFQTVAILSNHGEFRRIVFAVLTSFISLDSGFVTLQALEATCSSQIFHLSRTYFDVSRTNLVYTCMEFVDEHGGLRLISPSMVELQSMPIPMPYVHVLGRSGYIGGRGDIFPPISNSTGRVLWYMGSRYFLVDSHILQHGSRPLHYYGGTFVRYQRSDDSFGLA